MMVDAGVSPDEQLDRSQARQTLRRAARMLRPQKRRVLAAGVMVTFWAATVLAGPYLVLVAIDHGIRPGRPAVLNGAVAAYAVVAVLAYVTNRGQIRMISRVGEEFLRSMRERVFAHVQRLSMPFYDREKSGVVVSRMTSDVDSLSELVQMGLSMFVANGLLLLIALVVLAAVSWQLLLLCLAALPAMVLASRKFQRDSNRAYLEVRDEIGNTLSQLQEGVTGVRVVQAFAREDVQIERFQRGNRQLFDSHMRSAWVASWYLVAVELAGWLTTALVLGLGGWWAYQGTLTLGEVAFFVLALSNLFEPIQQLSNLFNLVQSAVAGLKKLFDLLDTPVDVRERPGAVDLPETGAVELTGVSFAYEANEANGNGSVDAGEADGAAAAPGVRGARGGSNGSRPSTDAERPADGAGVAGPDRRDRRDRSVGEGAEGDHRGAHAGPLVLQDVSLRIEPGTRLALVGPTGAGKSTLAKLAARLYDPTAGTVLYGGVDLRDATLDSLRERVAVIPQEGFLFNGSIRDNVRLARAGATDEEVDDALRAVGVFERFAGLPEGLGTPVRERGSRLSAGEKQLVSLARAALADPSVLVLDEATSSLDPGTEALVEEALDRLMEGRTVVVIAHRLSTAARADRVGVVVDGRLVELGPHEELITTGGHYAGLYRAWTSGLS